MYLEAGSYGKAVIGGANGGVAEAIADGETGVLLDTRDSAELVHAMRELLRDPARREGMGRRGAKEIVEAPHGAGQVWLSEDPAAAEAAQAIDLCEAVGGYEFFAQVERTARCVSVNGVKVDLID